MLMKNNAKFWLLFFLFWLGAAVYDTYRHPSWMTPWLSVLQWLSVALAGVAAWYHWQKGQAPKG
jgi:hypothetical protein